MQRLWTSLPALSSPKLIGQAAPQSRISVPVAARRSIVDTVSILDDPILHRQRFQNEGTELSGRVCGPRVMVTIGCNTPPSNSRFCELFKRSCEGEKLSICRPKRKEVEYVRVDQRISHLVDHCGLSLSLELCKDDNNEDDQALRLESSMP